MHSAAPLNSIYLGEYEPGASRMSDSDIEGWLRGAVSSDHHETGSLSMMPRDIGGVVDTKLRVYETRNVRVVGKRVSSGIYMDVAEEYRHRRIDYPVPAQCTHCKFFLHLEVIALK
jgi:hypothetical protein